MPRRIVAPAWLTRRGLARRALTWQLVLIAVCVGFAAAIGGIERWRDRDGCTGLAPGCSRGAGGAAWGWLAGGVGVWLGTLALVAFTGLLAPDRPELRNAVAVALTVAWLVAGTGLVVALVDTVT